MPFAYIFKIGISVSLLTLVSFKSRLTISEKYIKIKRREKVKLCGGF